MFWVMSWTMGWMRLLSSSRVPKVAQPSGTMSFGAFYGLCTKPRALEVVMARGVLHCICCDVLMMLQRRWLWPAGL